MNWLHKFVFVLGLIILIGCQPEVEPSPSLLVNADPHIQGTIAEVYESSNENIKFSFFIEGDELSSLAYKEAIVMVTEKTMFYQKDGNEYILVSSDNLSSGATVAILFVGPILTSSPSQATAHEIILLSK